MSFPFKFEPVFSISSNSETARFLWAFLQLQSLTRHRVLTTEVVLDMLESLPPNLDATYSNMLREIHPNLVPRAARALAWLAFSGRSLYVEELVDACAIDLKPSSVLGDRLTPYNIFEMLHDLVSIQPPLVSHNDMIPPRTHTIFLFHASVGDFLHRIKTIDAPEHDSHIETFHLEERKANKSIAKSCLAYLQHYNIPKSDYRDFPLLAYAWYNWDHHIDRGNAARRQDVDDTVIRRRALTLYSTLSRQSSPSYIGSRTQSLTMGHHLIPKWLDSMLQGRRMSKTTRLPSIYVEAEAEAGSSHPDESYTESPMQKFTDGLSPKDKLRLEEALNTPFFYPNFAAFFSPPSSPLGIYPPLKDSTRAVRFLEILPCLNSATEIRCRLFESSLAENPRYVALSYVWGSLDRECMANIQVQGTPVAVTPSQAQILLALRSRGEDSVPAIWLDFLCINQRDMRERSTQVLLMNRVFAQAKDVIIGLGEAVETDEKGIDFLGNVAALSSLSHYVGGTEHSDLSDSIQKAVNAIEASNDWEALAMLFRGPWWKRLWVVQEVVLAANAIVLIGSWSFNFNMIEQAINAKPAIEKLLSPMKRMSFSRLSSHPGWLGAKRILQTRSQWKESLGLPLPALLWRFREHRCTNIRDKIFALFGICCGEDVERCLGLVDYSLSASQTFTKLSVLIMESYKCLDMFSIGSAYDGDSYESISSWVPFTRALGSRKPLLLGVFDWPIPPVLYTACGHIGTLHIDFDRQSSGLILSGQVFDTIEHVENMQDSAQGNESLEALCGRISRHQEQLCGTACSDSQSNTEVRWRTLLADQWPMGQRLGQNKFRGCQVPFSPAEEAKLLKQSDVVEDMPFLERRAVVATKAGRLGLAPQECRSGDAIAVMTGGAVPYILRSTSTKDVYTLIGES